MKLQLNQTPKGNETPNATPHASANMFAGLPTPP